jgi:hypothetical protein
MAVNNKLDRRHDINAGERLPERHTRVLDEELYRANLPAFEPEGAGVRYYTLEDIRKALPPLPKPSVDIVKAGDLVYVGGHIEEVEEVLNETDMTVLIRGAKVGGCRLLPQSIQALWGQVKQDMGL